MSIQASVNRREWNTSFGLKTEDLHVIMEGKTLLLAFMNKPIERDLNYIASPIRKKNCTFFYFFYFDIRYDTIWAATNDYSYYYY